MILDKIKIIIDFTPNIITKMRNDKMIIFLDKFHYTHFMKYSRSCSFVDKMRVKAMSTIKLN